MDSRKDPSISILRPDAGNGGRVHRGNSAIRSDPPASTPHDGTSARTRVLRSHFPLQHAQVAIGGVKHILHGHASLLQHLVGRPLVAGQARVGTKKKAALVGSRWWAAAPACRHQGSRPAPTHL
jgi:hypothetical protein